ncbi:hypothetical protein ABT297_04200 [Dactylosporangium sp. NPDC000555]|uniref:hypothetical protein n=1 Tax=Dactylosporangium sp. NPDC000555 TaxID=3154260 RepID=UPI0033167D6D
MNQDRRRTHCPDGRPLYRVGEIPDHLATQTMLKRMRRRPADSQEPAGTLFYHGNKHAPLYEVAAAVALPELTGKTLARWTAARTCARCGSTSEHPIGIWHDRRLCDGCSRAERLAEVRPSQLALRLAAVDWARRIVAAPDAAVLACITVDRWRGPLHLYGVGFDGTVLLDITAAGKQTGGIPPVVTPGDAVHADEPLHVLTDLVGQRQFVHHTVQSDGRGWNTHSVTPVERLLDGIYDLDWDKRSRLLDLCRTRGPEHGTDNYEDRWRHWLCRPNPSVHWPSRGDSCLEYSVATAPTARRLAEDMLAGVRAIAADEHPDGPAACPVLPESGLEPCGSTDVTPSGVCPAHQQIEEADRG